MKIIVVFLFSLISIFAVGQISEESETVNDQLVTQESGLDTEEIEAAISKKKLKFDLEFGTTFGAGSYGSYVGTYVAPQVTYPVSSRFSFSVGGYFSGVSPLSQTENSAVFGYPYGSFYTRSYLFVKGAYQLTENLVVSGMAYKEIDLYNPNNPGNPGQSFNNRGFIMGVDYKIGDNIFIRGQVEISNGNSPYHYTPFMSSPGRGMFDPFHPTH